MISKKRQILVISAKELTKDLINGYKILNGAKFFSAGVSQNDLVFISAKEYFINFITTSKKFICGNLKEFQKEVLKM